MTAASQPDLDPAEIRDRHLLVYRQIQDNKEQFKTNPDLQEKFEKLVRQLEQLTIEADRNSNWTGCEWLEAAMVEWQKIFPDRDLRHEIGLPAGHLPTSPETTKRRTRLPYSVIRGDLNLAAYNIGAKRKMRVVTERIKELRGIEENPGGIHSVIASSREEQDEDWRFALVYFASDVLSGRTDFANQLSSESWRELERVSLEEVKRLNAYHISLTDSRRSDPTGCYLKACAELNAAVLCPDMKSAPLAFPEVREFLKTEYSCGESFPRFSTGNPAAEGLKAGKAETLYQTRNARGGRGTAADDWKCACEYLSVFCDNVIDAIEGEEKKAELSMRRVLSAFQEPWRGISLVNCFEAAVAIYFFPPDRVERCSKNAKDIL